MPRGPFDYPYTCPDVDKLISKADNVIEQYLASLIEEASPLLGQARLQELARDNAKSLYEELEPIFEGVRETNEKMRDAANDQINELQGQIRDLESQVADLSERVET